MTEATERPEVEKGMIRVHSENGELLPARWIELLGQIAHFGLATAVVFGIAYLLGHTMLRGPLPGNDSPLHVGYATWLNQYFPAIPHWYPLQGGGVSLLHGYPILGHFLVVLVHRVSELTILQAFRLLSFLAFPLTAMGIYLFCWIAMRRQTVGLIAAVFYLLAPITWTWMYDWGFFAQQMALVFMPPAVLAFERALHHQLDKRRGGRGRLWFVALLVLMLGATLAHMLVAMAAGLVMALYGGFSVLTATAEKRYKTLRGMIKVLGLLVASLGSMAAVYLLPFLLYGQVADREGLNTPAAHMLHRLPVLEFFGLKGINPSEILTRMQFPLVISGLAVLGLLFAAFYRRNMRGSSPKFLALGLAGGLATVYALSPGLASVLLGISPTLHRLVNFRTAVLAAMVLMPLMAAYSVWALAFLIIWPERALGFDRHAKRGGGSWIRKLRTSGVSVAAMLLAFVIAGPVSARVTSEPWRLSYGPLPSAVDLRDLWGRGADDPCGMPASSPNRPSLCDVPTARSNLNIAEFTTACATLDGKGQPMPDLCTMEDPTPAAVETFVRDCRTDPVHVGSDSACPSLVEPLWIQLQPSNWPALAIDAEDPSISEVQQLARHLPAGDSIRLDVSPHLGRIAQDLVAYAGASQINSYTFQISLIHEMWGYQQNVFFSKDEGVSEYGNPDTLETSAWWFGTEQILLDPELDPVETYREAGWERVVSEDELEIWRNPDPPGIATATDAPTILLLGKPETNSYMTVFRLANDGLVPPNEALLVEGRPRIDSYSLSELESFDAVLLYGHDYRNSGRAWRLLADYVTGGGSLFVETGWEFWIPEWEFEKAPEVLPMERLSWTDYGTPEEYEFPTPEIGGEVNVNQFKPLTWEGEPWQVSGGEASDVRPWGRVVLSTDGRPLIVAGEFGQGRVVWSGMNLIAHSRYLGKNEQELQLLHNLIGWLTGDQRPGTAQMTWNRVHPDRVNFGVESAQDEVTWLYWREAYYPNWRANISDGTSQREAPIYRAGPGFMLIPIRAEADSVSVNLSWQPSMIERLAVVPSVFGLLFLLALFIDGLFFSGNLFTWIRIAMVMRMPRPFLGDGSNRAWAEQKRAEMQAARRKRQRVKSGRSGSNGDSLAPASHEPELESNGHPGDHGLETDRALNERETELLRKWISDSSSDQDTWVENILSKAKDDRSQRGSPSEADQDASQAKQHEERGKRA